MPSYQALWEQVVRLTTQPLLGDVMGCSAHPTAVNASYVAATRGPGRVGPTQTSYVTANATVGWSTQMWGSMMSSDQSTMLPSPARRSVRPTPAKVASSLVR